MSCPDHDTAPDNCPTDHLPITNSSTDDSSPYHNHTHLTTTA
jgi:hypothetical protein